MSAGGAPETLVMVMFSRKWTEAFLLEPVRK